MSRQYIFIDDSGDPGLKKSNTTHFIVAAVLLVDYESLKNLTTALNGFRAGLGWNELDEFKFSSTNKKTIKKLLGFIRQFKFESYAAVIDKTKIVTEPRLSSGETLNLFRNLKRAQIKITNTNTCNQRESKPKSSSPIAITFSDYSEALYKSNGVFISNSFA